MPSTRTLLVTILVSLSTVCRGLAESCCDHDAGFDPKAAAQRAQQSASHSWEYGTVAEALLELYNPRLSVFSPQAFPAGGPPDPDPQLVPALAYAKRHIRLDSETLIAGGGASGDPASLGVSALMIGRTHSKFMEAAKRQFDHLERVPKWSNGAISHREDVAELWSDFVYMAPPFMAYYAVATNSTETIKKALMQCLKYREVLKPNVSTEVVSAGAWQHITGPQNEDRGLWSTGNGWVAMGMARVLATLLHWPPTAIEADAQIAQADLFTWIGEILQAAMSSPKDKGLLRNYLNDTTWFGEVSGTAVLTATVYRVAAMQEEASALFSGQAPKVKKTHPDIKKPVSDAMLKWADDNRKAIATQVQQSGSASPAVNSLSWKDRKPVTKDTPESESFLVMLYASWRDCVKAGACEDCPAITTDIIDRPRSYGKVGGPQSHVEAETRSFILMNKHPATPLGLGLGLRLESARSKLQKIIERVRSQATNAAKTSATPIMMLSTSPSSHTTTFFDLPAELRNAIYERVAAATGPLNLTSRPGTPAPPALLLTSRQCRLEFLTILLRAAILHVSVTDLNFTKLIAALSRLRESERSALAQNPNLLITFKIKKCGSEVYANLRAWCQFQAELSSAPFPDSDESQRGSSGLLNAAAAAPVWHWHYTIPRSPPTNPAQLDWYCGRARVLAARSSGDERVRREVEKVLEVLDGERTGKAELGSWNMGFGEAYALYVAGAARRM